MPSNDNSIHPDTYRTDDWDTSVEAAEAIEGTREGLKLLILALLNAYGDMTDEEIRDRVRGLGYRVAHSSPAKRRTDLYHEGLVEDSGARRINRNGRSMIVWHSLTDAELADPARGRGIVPPYIEDAIDRKPLATSIALELWRSWGMNPHVAPGRWFAQTVEAVLAGMEGHA